MNGLLIVNKQQGITSHDIVNEMRRIFKTKQIGHLGTLDPLAEGVLVICIGDSTKLVQFLENVTKEYVCEITFGIETDTFDITGKTILRENISELDLNMVDAALRSFEGKSLQTPPMFSAIKKNGKKLYEYARKKIEVEIEPREIEISKIERISPIVYDCENGTAKLSFKTIVSKGTYIRSICHDLGVKLGVPATMSNLKRTRNGSFEIDNSYTVDDIKNGNFSLISNLEALKGNYFIDNDEVIKKAVNGMKISLLMIKNLIGLLPEKIVICQNNSLIAIYVRDDEIHCYKAARVWK